MTPFAAASACVATLESEAVDHDQHVPPARSGGDLLRA